MEMISSRNPVADALVESSLSPVMSRAVTTISMEHAVPELRITAEVCRVFFHKLFYVYYP
jgi:hypothetical protein